MKINKKSKFPSFSASKQKKQQSSPLSWLCLGFIFGIVFTNAWKHLSMKELILNKLSILQPSISNQYKLTKNTKADHRSDFTFYTMLPNMDLQDEKKMQITKLKAPSKYDLQTKQIEQYEYILHIDSLPNTKAADKLKAKLVLYGFIPTIQNIKKNKSYSFQITLGPFNNEQQALDQQQLLTKYQMKSTLIKQTKHKE